MEDFDLQRRADEAEQVLAAWSTLWHPLLLASARVAPSWLPATTPPLDPAGHLIVIPDFCESSLPDGWLSQAEAAGACVLRNLQRRDDMLAAALERLGGDPTPIDPDLAADFLALGYCHFQVEVLTRKLHYTSNLDEAALHAAALSAVDATLQGDAAAARRHLQSAFDRLHDARDYSNHVELRLLDLTLVASTTLGALLRTDLSSPLPRNLLISGAVVEEMAQREPETLETLKRALAAGTATLIGGEYTELPLPLLTPEAIRLDLHRGLAAYAERLGQRPFVFGRRRFGLTPTLPQILERLGFTAAFHCTLDDGRFPAGNQSRIQWEGIDGTTIKALGCLPIDAERTESFLRLAEKLSDAISVDSTATIMLAHWPGKVSPWYDDLRRIAAYGSVLGTFTTVADYFEQTSLAGQRNHYKSDQYRPPYLKQDVAAGRRDPISRWIRYFRRRAETDAGETIRTLAALCGSTVEGERGKGESGACGGTRGTPPVTPSALDVSSSGQLATVVEDSLAVDEDLCAALDDRIANLQQRSLGDLAHSLAGAASAARGCLLVNPWTFPQQTSALPALSPSANRPIDVPAMGFAWIGPGAEVGPAPAKRRGWFGRRKRPEPPLAEDHVLRNEFFEVWFDPHTGAIRSISDYYSRDPRLAQQIALRLPGDGAPESDVHYSIMSADEVTVTSAGPALGEIRQPRPADGS